MSERVDHCFEPVFDDRSRVLLLGTMPSPASRRYNFYYSHPRNRMWQCLSRLLGEPTPETPEQKRALLLCHGIAMWDVLRSCEIDGASDASIRSPEPNDVAGLLRSSDIRAIFTTGAKAGELYRRYILPECGREAAVLPSTSPANAAAGMDTLLERYSVILEYIEGL